MTRYHAFAAVLLVSATVSAPALAAETRPFDAAVFAAAQAQGRPILVDVKAWWCPVCASQGRTIKALSANPAYQQMVIFDVNYDKDKDALKRFGVSKQGTLIAFHGGRQTGRIDFDTDKAKIAALLASTAR
jgi:thioredoxin 1